MIHIENVTHHYGIRPVLKNISMEIRTGEVVVVNVDPDATPLLPHLTTA
jgi:ABC-type polar amino acid transport system ATPase subunit